MRNSEPTIYAHIQLNIQLNESDYSYYDPRVDTSIGFSIPLELMDGKKLAELIQTRLKLLEDKLPEARAEYERKQAEKEAEEARKKVEVTP